MCIFNDADFQTVMRQIALAVTVLQEREHIPSQSVDTDIKRNLSIFQALKILEKTKVRVRLKRMEVKIMQ